MRRPLTGLLATSAVAAALIAGNAALASDDPDAAAPTAAPTAALSPEATPPPVGAIQADQAAAFRVLRRPQSASDAIPTNVAREVAGPGRFGRNPELARAVDTATGPGWVVPGRGVLCLVVPDPVDGYGTSCVPTDVATKQGVGVQVVSPDSSTSSTLLPDDARVVVTQDDQTTDVVRPDGSGVAATDTTDAARVTVVSDEGRTTTPVPDADGTVAPVN